MSRLAILLVLSSAFVASSQRKKEPDKKDQPRILYAVPLVVAPGEKQKLALRGKHLDAVEEIEVGGAEGAKVKVLGGKKTPVGANQPGDRIGDTEVEIELELPKGTKPGATLTAVGPGGESTAYTLLIPDDTPRVKEKEPNDGFDAAQVIPLPAAVEATIENEKDADVFKFEGKKGDELKIEVQAARFGSPVDAILTLLDGDRKILAAVDDSDGSPDPVLTIALPRDGVYFATVIDAHDLGGPQFGYRLLVRRKK